MRLRKILALASVVYFVGFLWIFSQGSIARLFIPFQWQNFFELRTIATVLYGKWYFYGDSLVDLFLNWLFTVGLIAGIYLGLVWIVGKQKAVSTPQQD
ncbi:MAG: hypothetical protein B7Y86_11190 [Brevundimonas subvibrioides]|uniref:Uncharacterized protein n=1 Tax=Brevundimonas subvibrioides TaxID=74313 RepID=A0A258HG77_9CAUL|nr:MAG: hypothetical protein B7Y86_11190 [Brevundimonas subvibrioides]